jgi:hypothetical protein
MQQRLSEERIASFIAVHPPSDSPRIEQNLKMQSKVETRRVTKAKGVHQVFNSEMTV